MRGRRWAVVSCCALGASAVAQPYLDVPYVTTQSPQVFTSLFTKSRCGTVRVVLLGDSQETAPGGAGAVYIPRLQYELWARVGNAPETPWMQLGASTGGGSPWADWLWRGGNIPGGLTVSRLSEAETVPGLSPAKTSTTNGNNINGNQVYGNLLMLQHDCANVSPSAMLSGLGPFFDRTDPIGLDVLAATNASSGEVRVRVTPAPTAQTGFFFPSTAFYNSAMGLQSGTPEFRAQRFGPLPMGAGQYMQVELAGTDSAAFTDLVAARFVNLADPRGWAITSLSRGGYKALDLAYFHPACGPMIGALGPDVAFICYGANDASGNTPPPDPVRITPARYRADLEWVIAYLRQHTRADLPIVLISDPARTNLPDPEAGEYLDAQPGIHRDMALADPLVCALNSRRLTHEAGWTPQNGAPYLADGVHYTPYGAQLKAQLEVQALFAAFFPPPTDCNTNGVDDRCDIASGTSLDLDGDGVPDECACSPDVNCDGAANGVDVEVQERAVGGDLADYCLPDADFNSDGAINGFDVASVETAVGTGECP
ncbi:MAG: hypothetical protein HBSAPP03_10620 [Phycisphaerae bacterium]|nr:MAG: hypothetical protein HBSAPP03_10620 [Phycisphaerae bacterium]